MQRWPAMPVIIRVCARTRRRTTPNLSTTTTAGTQIGDIALETPRDRDGSSLKAPVPNGSRSIGGHDELTIPLPA